MGVRVKRGRPVLARVVGVLCAMLVVVTAAGCAAPPPPEPEPRPTLVWPQGEPSGSLGRDPWVVAAREAEEQLARAVNTADYGSELLQARWTPGVIEMAVMESRGLLLHDAVYVLRGPRAFEPLGVLPSEDGERAEVPGCTTVLPIEHEVPPVGAPDDTSTFLYALELGDDGERRVVFAGTPDEEVVLPSGEILTEELCSGMDVRQALFDPPPDLEALAAKAPEDLVVP